MPSVFGSSKSNLRPYSNIFEVADPVRSTGFILVLNFGRSFFFFKSSNFDKVSLDNFYILKPLISHSSAAITPGPPASVSIAIFLPLAGGWKIRALPILKNSRIF